MTAEQLAAVVAAFERSLVEVELAPMPEAWDLIASRCVDSARWYRRVADRFEDFAEQATRGAFLEGGDEG